MEVLALYNIKGGVGKTACAVNLAYLSSLEGARTLLWDLDPQGAATFYFRIKPKIKGGGRRLIQGKQAVMPLVRGTDYEGLDLLPADFSFRHLDLELDRTKRPARRLGRVLAKLETGYDRVFLDCAPSISLVSESVFQIADLLLVPTIPTTLSQRTLQQLQRHLDESALKPATVLPFFSMVDKRKALHRELCGDLRHEPLEFLSTAIPNSTWVEKMGIHRAPLETFAPRSQAAAAYRELWIEVLGRLRR